MIVAYIDSSVLLKRVVEDEGADAARTELRAIDRQGGILVSSSLAWIEVSRALQRLGHDDVTLPSDATPSDALVETALSGVAEHPITAQVVAVARRLGPPGLRSLDAIHLASALLADASVVLTYDNRLADAARQAHLVVQIPGPSRR